MRIKEVVEEYRCLPCGLRSMIFCEGIAPCPLRDDVKYELDKLGYLRGTKRFNKQRNQWEGKFRKETIRDATEEEFLSWVVIELNKNSPEYEQSITSHGLIAGLFKCTNEYTLIKAGEILSGKKIVEE